MSLNLFNLSGLSSLSGFSRLSGFSGLYSLRLCGIAAPSALLLFTALLSFLLFPGTLSARGEAILVLPFQVNGNFRSSPLRREELSVDLQEAAHFFLEISTDHLLVDLQRTKSVVRKNGFRPADRLSPTVAASLCSLSKAAFLLAATGDFTARGEVSLKAVSFSCGSARVIARSRRRAPIDHLQGALRRLLKEALPFMQFQAIAPRFEDPSPIDLIAIIDLSGSMSRELQEIAGAFEYLKAHLPGGAYRSAAGSLVRDRSRGSAAQRRGSRLGVIAMSAGDQINAWPITFRWERILTRLRAQRARGEVRAQGLQRALEAAERYRDWRGRPVVMIFSDAPINSEKVAALGTVLRRLRQRGIRTLAFSLQNQRVGDHILWERLAAIAGLEYYRITYARPIFFLDGESLVLIRQNSRFYRTQSHAIVNTIVNVLVKAGAAGLEQEGISPLESWQFSERELNLELLPYRYARLHGRKLTRAGAISSDLRKRIEDSVTDPQKRTDGNSSSLRTARILVKERGQAFWIEVAEEYLAQFRRQVGKRMLVGLHFRAATAGERLEVAPAPIYLRDRGRENVPQLLRSDWPTLSRKRLAAIHPQDIWFLWLQVLRIEDERAGKDIRY